MKKIVLFVFVICVNLLSAQNVNFGPSTTFKTRLVNSTTTYSIAYNEQGNYMKVDANSDGLIQVSEALQVKEIRLESVNLVTGLTGLEYFTNLQKLKLTETDVVNVNLQTLTYLKNLEVRGTAFTGVTLSGLPNLENIKITQTKLAAIDLSGLISLKTVDISHNKIINAVNFSGLTLLETVDASYNAIPSANFSGAIKTNTINIVNNGMQSLNLQGLQNSLENLNVGINGLTTLNLTGFTKLKTLSCINNLLNVLDIQSLEKLEMLYANNNHISEIHPENLQFLKHLELSNNDLSSIVVQPLAAKLEYLSISNNNFSGNFELHDFPNLKHFYCDDNDISTLQIINMPKLAYFDCSNNHISELNLSTLTGLSNVVCENNLLTTLSIEGIYVPLLRCKNNLLVTLYLKNGASENVDFSGNPTLTYICADEIQLPFIESLLISYNQLQSVNLNSYCNNIPSVSNHLTGTARFFESPTSTVPARILPYTLINANGYWLSTNQAGIYHHFQSGTAANYVTISLENQDLLQTESSYFSFASTFGEEVLRDLKCWPNPTLSAPDMEGVMIPLNTARPGEDVYYRLLIRNKGNTSASGNVTMTFDNLALHLLQSASSQITQNGNILNLQFTDLLPMESKTTDLVFHINSPIDTPPVSSNYWLNFNANISLSNSSDYKPEDNTFVYNDVVVNSFDPNDKTCLEGSTILPSAAGKYVHYVIRFENTGTAPAQRIVVSDLIDTTKFDLYSLVPLSSSHNFRLAMRNSTADFIFENINLPFEDGSNDGYVAFKIKTLPSLVAGNSFSNKASIYFDYNFPIITNTATTTLSVLAADSRNSESIFTVYPNPVHNSLKLAVKSGIAVNAVSVYNALGQLVLALPKNAATDSIDLSMLQAGNYFVKLATDHGTAVKSIIKE